MKLYHNPLSPNARRPLLVARHLGLSLDEQLLDFTKGEHKAPEYLALNPNGMVPTLVDGEFVLFESRAIVQYLALQKPESGLFPSDDRVRVDIARWQFWDAAHFAKPLGELGYQKLVKPMMGLGDPDPSAVEGAIEGFRRFGAVLDAHLDGREHLVGDRLTIADFTVAASLQYAGATGAPVDELTHVKRWFGAMQGLDAWKSTEPKMG